MPIRHPLLRVPPKGLSGLTILSHDTVGTYTHYWHGRTQPCPGEQCEACDDNQLPRWRGYLYVMSGRSESIGVLELTPAAMAAIDKAFRQHRTLRGCRLAIERKGGKPNGELRAHLTPPPKDVSYLPKAPSLKKYLAKLWGLHVVKPLAIVTDDMLRDRAADNGKPNRRKVS